MAKRGKSIGVILITLMLAVALMIGSCAPAKPVEEERTIKVGVRCGFTGPIATNAVPAGYGMIDRLVYANDYEGGIGGIPIRYKWADDAYMIPRGFTSHKRFKD